MKRLIPFVLLLSAACTKESVRPQTNGIVKYGIEGDTVEIVDSSSHSVAQWIYSSSPSKGYGLKAYNSTPDGKISYMILFYIETDKIEPNHNYLKEVSGSILRNSTDYVSGKDLEGTYILLTISKLQDQNLSGKFTGNLKNLNTNELVEISGTFDNVKLIK